MCCQLTFQATCAPPAHIPPVAGTIKFTTILLYLMWPAIIITPPLWSNWRTACSTRITFAYLSSVNPYTLSHQVFNPLDQSVSVKRANQSLNSILFALVFNFYGHYGIFMPASPALLPWHLHDSLWPGCSPWVARTWGDEAERKCLVWCVSDGRSKEPNRHPWACLTTHGLSGKQGRYPLWTLFRGHWHAYTKN